MGDVTVCRIPKEGSNSFYIVQAEWHDSSFEMVLLEKESAWAGEMSTAQIQEFCQQWDYTVDDYISETRTALTTLTGANLFSYLLHDETFTWKKHSDATGNIKVKFGFIKLRSVPIYSTFELLMDNVLQKVKKCEEQIRDLECEKINFKNEREVLIKKLDCYATEKAKMEENLYSKFLAILNAKKEKIESLQQQQLPPPSESDEKKAGEVDEGDSHIAIKKAKTVLPKRKVRSKQHSTVDTSSARAPADVSSTNNTFKPSTSRQDTSDENEDIWDYAGETQVDESDLDEDNIWNLKKKDFSESPILPVCQEGLPKRKRQMKR